MGSLPKPCTLQIKVDPVKPTMPMWSYPIEVALTADTRVALPLLEQALVRLATANLQQRWTGRRGERPRLPEVSSSPLVGTNFVSGSLESLALFEQPGRTVLNPSRLRMGGPVG